MKRNRRLFSAYEMELLARNPYTYRVRARQLLFTAEFKRRFWEQYERGDRKSTRLNSSHYQQSRMPSSA